MNTESGERTQDYSVTGGSVNHYTIVPVLGDVKRLQMGNLVNHMFSICFTCALPAGTPFQQLVTSVFGPLVSFSQPIINELLHL